MKFFIQVALSYKTQLDVMERELDLQIIELGPETAPHTK